MLFPADFLFWCPHSEAELWPDREDCDGLLVLCVLHRLLGKTCSVSSSALVLESDTLLTIGFVFLFGFLMSSSTTISRTGPKVGVLQFYVLPHARP